MKIISTKSKKMPAARLRERGMATFVFIVLLGVMMILVASNVRSILELRANEKWIEQKQIERLNLSQTNVIVKLPAKAKLK